MPIKQSHYTLLQITFLFAFLFIMLFSLTACSAKQSSEKEAAPEEPLPALSEPISDTAFLLNTSVTVTLYDRGSQELIRDTFALCEKYESQLSRTIEDSEISKINNAATYPVEVSETTAGLLSSAYHYSELSGGAFDLTIAPITALWDFSAPGPAVPSAASITEAVSHVDYRDVKIEGTSVTLAGSRTSIDLGAIAKGYIADRMKEYLLSRGVQSAIINLGGNVLCIGAKPDGTPFKIGIQKPFEARNETALVLGINNLSVVSSGIYERYFKTGGKLYHHILNPDTGYPYENNLIAVSIISPLSVDGDGLSTTCFALGLKKGLELIDSIPDTHAVFITDDYTLHYSKDFQQTLTIIPD